MQLDTFFRYIFFTTIGETPKLERALLDGSNRMALVQNKQVVRPQVITLDFVNEHIYWADSYLDKIERINYDGTGRVIDVIKKSWVSSCEHSLFSNLYFP